MALASDEKKLAEAAYGRIRLWRRYRYGGYGASLMGLAPASISIIKIIDDPHSSHRSVAIFSALMGILWGLGVASAFALSRERKRDEAVVRFFESRFPDDCSWKQEEKILAEAEDIRLKAKVDLLIEQAAS